MCATHMLSQSEASNAQAGRGSIAQHTPAAEVRDQPLASQEPGMRKQQGQHGATL